MFCIRCLGQACIRGQTAPIVASAECDATERSSMGLEGSEAHSKGLGTHRRLQFSLHSCLDLCCGGPEIFAAAVPRSLQRRSQGEASTHGSANLVAAHTGKVGLSQLPCTLNLLPSLCLCVCKPRTQAYTVGTEVPHIAGAWLPASNLCADQGAARPFYMAG